MWLNILFILAFVSAWMLLAPCSPLRGGCARPPQAAMTANLVAASGRNGTGAAAIAENNQAPAPQPFDFTRDVIEASRHQPVLVDFHATWCGPCRIVGPILDEVVRESKTPLTLVKIDVDQHADIAQTAGVSGIPDVRLFVNGQQVGAFTGARSKPTVERFLADQLAPATK